MYCGCNCNSIQELLFCWKFTIIVDVALTIVCFFSFHALLSDAPPLD